MRKKILFYMQVPFLDVNLEFIKYIKTSYDLHILIELPTTQLKANILNLSVDLNQLDAIVSYWDIAEKWKLTYLAEFFEGCSSVGFVIYTANKQLTNLYNTTKAVIKFINTQNFNWFHFDDFSARQAFLLPFINAQKKLVLNIHDPSPHKGEFEWKRYLIKKLFYKKVTFFITFSNFSKIELSRHLGPNSKIFVYKLLPYTVYKKFKTVKQECVKEEEKYITFFGRLSAYKGIDILLMAIIDILKEFPNQKFLVAGRATFGYTPNFKQLGNALQSVSIIERHLSNEEISNLLANSKLVVCPYVEATQSGVIMTAYALNCPVLVTNIGGLAEYVMNDVTGLIADEITKEGIVAKIKEFLNKGLYQQMNSNLQENYFKQGSEKHNLNVIKAIYNC